VATWGIGTPNGPALALSPICTGAVTTWNVPAGGTVEQTEPVVVASTLGSNQLDVYFNTSVIPGSPVSTNFLVQ
jgi:hypothetical protein